MPRPVNIEQKLPSLVVLPSGLYRLMDKIIGRNNPSLGDLVRLINEGQKAFNQIKPFLPPNNNVTHQDWENAVTARNWRERPESVIDAVGLLRARANAFTTAYETQLLPAIFARQAPSPRLLVPLSNAGEMTGFIYELNGFLLLPAEMDLIRDSFMAYRRALEPFAEL